MSGSLRKNKPEKQRRRSLSLYRICSGARRKLWNFFSGCFPLERVQCASEGISRDFSFRIWVTLCGTESKSPSLACCVMDRSLKRTAKLKLKLWFCWFVFALKAEQHLKPSLLAILTTHKGQNISQAQARRKKSGPSRATTFAVLISVKFLSWRDGKRTWPCQERDQLDWTRYHDPWHRDIMWGKYRQEWNWFLGTREAQLGQSKAYDDLQHWSPSTENK